MKLTLYAINASDNIEFPVLSIGVWEVLSNISGLKKLKDVVDWGDNEPRLLEAELVDGRVHRVVGGFDVGRAKYRRDLLCERSELELEVVFVPFWMALNVPEILQGELTGRTLACVTREELEQIIVRNQELGLLM